ncbi:TenA family protein [Leekyejoonella antrihumi]|uniref:Thiaminase II n=1 Tax=Leekyejoonella antrihumi TaxID=1660198 RepID=A0A563E8T4_9MICO|nr:TenA family protein [Leekyejoonella antrihumi]TWP38930.1 thiaminase II [Leekyejoonella antrihumi]
MTLFASLKAGCEADWKAYTRHEFVSRLGAGTLPMPAFQDYLVQDYLFLIQFARANGLAAYKSRRLIDLRQAHDALGAILAETDLHLRLTERWGIARAELDAALEKQATVAYTRYVLDNGMAGDLLDLFVALAPCVIGYAEIGRHLAPELSRGDAHPYCEWIAEYASDEYQATAAAAIERLDILAGELVTGRRLDELSTVFGTATRLETAFWQQAVDADFAPAEVNEGSR